MARLARVVVPGVPHHITQRGNRRQPVFFSDDDYLAYLDILAEWSRKAAMSVWAYCLMPNHVHIIAVPEQENSLHAALGETHRRYSCRVNFREGWRGHLWQGRFASFPMDEAHTLRAVRYVELNPVRAGLAAKPEDWRWSSARAHILHTPDELVDRRALAEIWGHDPKIPEIPEIRGHDPKWEDHFGHVPESPKSPPPEGELEVFRRHERTGRPLGDTAFLQKLEWLCGRTLLPQKRGPKGQE